MKLNTEKLQQFANPLSEKEQMELEHQIENQGWLLLSVRLAMKIRSIMASEGITQVELARRMGVSTAQVSKILSGHENLGLKTIAKIETALGKALYSVEIEDQFFREKDREEIQYVHGSKCIIDEPVENEFTFVYSACNVDSYHYTPYISHS